MTRSVESRIAAIEARYRSAWPEITNNQLTRSHDHPCGFECQDIGLRMPGTSGVLWVCTGVPTQSR